MAAWDRGAFDKLFQRFSPSGASGKTPQLGGAKTPCCSCTQWMDSFNLFVSNLSPLKLRRSTGFLSHFQDFMVTQIQFDAAFVGFTRRVTAMALLRQRWLAPRGVTPRVAKLRRLARWVKRKGPRPPRPPRAGNGDGSDAEPSGAPETAMEKIVLSKDGKQTADSSDCAGAQPTSRAWDVCNANDKDGKFCSDRKSQTSRKRSFSRPRLCHPFDLHPSTIFLVDSSGLSKGMPPSKAAPPKKTPEDVVASVLSDMGSRPGVSAKPFFQGRASAGIRKCSQASRTSTALSSPVAIPVLHVEHLPVYLGAFCKTSPPLPRNLALCPPAPLQPPPPPPPPPPPVNSLTCPWNMKRLYILDALNLLTHRNQGEENDKSLRWSQLESAAQYYHHRGDQVLIFSEWLRGHSLELHRLEMRFGPGCVVSTPAEEGVDSVDILMLKKAMMERQNDGKAFIVTNNRLEKFKSCADVDLSNLVVKYAMARSTFIPQDLQG